MSDNAANLSFSTLFNQPKILINDNQVVTVPVTAPGGLDTLLTIPTAATDTPLPPRVNILYNNIFGSAFGVTGDSSTVFGIGVQFVIAFDASFNLVIQSVSTEIVPVDVDIYYRVYVDERDS